MFRGIFRGDTELTRRRPAYFDQHPKRYQKFNNNRASSRARSTHARTWPPSPKGDIFFFS